MDVAATRIVQVKLFATLFFFWILLNGNFAIDTVFAGVLVAAVITVFFHDGLSFFTEFRLTPQALIATVQYFYYFFKALLISNFQIAAIVISPDLPINPGIVKVRTKLKSRMGRLLLANSITLTPGTLTVEMSDEFYYIHWVTVETVDIDEASERIVAGFEKYLEVMYG